MTFDNYPLDDVEITWQKSNSDGVFSEVGEVTQDYEIPKDNLKLDVLMIFKKTTFRTIAEYLLQELRDNSRDSKIEEIMKFVYVIIMYVISPRSTSVYFFDNNEYREMEGLFETEYGVKYITKQSIESIPQADLVINILKRNKILEEDGDRCYVIGHILKNLQIKNQPLWTESP